MKTFQKTLLLVLALVICIGFTACSAPSDSSVSDSIEKEEDSSSIVDGDIDRKIVYNVDLNIETDDVKKLRDALKSECDSVSGYIEYNDESYDDGELSSVTVKYRIPTDKLDAFIDAIEGKGEIESKNVSLTDITTSYVNASAQKSALEERKAQLEELLEDQNISAGDKISVINEISEVNTQLMEIQLLIDGYDSMVNYSTVEVSINQKATFLEIFFGICLIFGIPIGVPAAIVIIVIKILKRKPQEFTGHYNNTI